VVFRRQFHGTEILTAWGHSTSHCYCFDRPALVFPNAVVDWMSSVDFISHCSKYVHTALLLPLSANSVVLTKDNQLGLEARPVAAQHSRSAA
jgi:hypothetical protein